MKRATFFRTIAFLAAGALGASSALNAEDAVVVQGSDTLGAKMVPQLAEAFKAKKNANGHDVAFEISAEGSSTGIAGIIDGTTDIGMSSRLPKDKEFAKAKANGVDMTPIEVGKDGIAIIVNASNPLDSITSEQVEMIFTGDVVDWSAISLQTGRISAYTRNTSSGTYRVFQRLALNSRDYGPNTQKMAGNENIASEVANNPNGIGYVGLAYIDTPGVKVLPVDGHRPDNRKKYPFARPLYYLIDRNETPSEAANDFIGFTLSPRGQTMVEDVDFLPIY